MIDIHALRTELRRQARWDFAWIMALALLVGVVVLLQAYVWTWMVP